MFRWIPYTFVRITLFFIGGILVSIHFGEVVPEVFMQVTLVVVVSGYLVVYAISRWARRAIVDLGWIGLPAIFLFGYLHLLLQTDSRKVGHIVNLQSGVVFYEAIVSRYPEEKERTWKQEAVVTSARTGTGWVQCDGTIILYFSKADFPDPFRYGDRLLIRGHPQEVQPPSNPGEFDYKRFLSYRNIYHQHFLRSGDVLHRGNNPPSVILNLAFTTRLWASRVIRKFVDGDRERATASALVLGVTDGLDNELLDAYSASGSMHVLAVSGLHVSILYMIILVLLRPLQKSRTGRWVLATIALFLLWGYAFVTGLSPSVQRAVMMFSFIAVARPAGLHTNIYNTLASSAFCLLLIDPYLIMSVGFQLSYLAVLAIVFVHPRVYRLWEAPGWFSNHVWTITSVSLAAQLGTFVPALFYFHQFPNYFLLANLLVIPVSFVVLVAGVALLAVGIIPLCGHVVGWVLTWSVRLLNGAVFTVDTLPFSVTEGLYIDPPQACALMAVVVSIMVLLEFRGFGYVWTVLVAVLALGVFQWRHFRRDVDVRKITVYNIRGHSAMDFFDRGRAWFLADSQLREQPDKIDFHIQPNRLISGVEQILKEEVPFARKFRGAFVIQWSSMRILLLQDRNYRFPPGIRPDLIVIANNAVSDFNTFSKEYQGVSIVLDSSNGYYYTEKFTTAMAEAGISAHSVMQDGAYEILLEEERR